MTGAVPKGRIVWSECLTSDPKKAMDFYTGLFGWTITTMPGPVPYHQWTNNGRTIGGTMQLPEEARAAGAPSHWLMYVATPSVDETHAQATKLGGRTFVPPTDIPGVGRFAVMADPQGAMFAVYAPSGTHNSTDDPPGVGEFSWHELATTDYQAAGKFYAALFGWEMRDAHDMGPLGIYQIFGRPGIKHDSGGMFNRPPEMPVSAWCLYVTVTDIDAIVAKIGQLGGQVVNGPMEVHGGDRIAQAIDPTGAFFAVHQSAR